MDVSLQTSNEKVQRQPCRAAAALSTRLVPPLCQLFRVLHPEVEVFDQVFLRGKGSTLFL